MQEIIINKIYSLEKMKKNRERKNRITDLSQRIIISVDGATYCVKSIFNEKATLTMNDKIQRLINKDANCS